MAFHFLIVLHIVVRSHFDFDISIHSMEVHEGIATKLKWIQKANISRLVCKKSPHTSLGTLTSVPALEAWKVGEAGRHVYSYLQAHLAVFLWTQRGPLPGIEYVIQMCVQAYTCMCVCVCVYVRAYMYVYISN